MNPSTIIEVSNLSKRYQIGSHNKKSQEEISAKNIEVKRNKRFIWALKDVSFNVRRGEILGVIGHNGAGKSTLFKVLSRITGPTEGKVIINGHVVSLLELGAGFHPDLTGKENVYFNGALLGMNKKEIDEKYTLIVSFAGLENFMETPIKHYSSGMYMRLAFAVAIHINSDILIVDEVLAVGDVEFRDKCIDRLKELSSQGTTILFVSHSMEFVEHFCKRTIVLKNGSIHFFGNTQKAIQTYLESIKKVEIPND